MKGPTVFGITLIGLVLAVPIFGQTNLAGDWDVTLNTPMGPLPAKLTFKQDGNQLTGTIDGPVGVVPIVGTVTGSDLNFSWTADAGGQTVTINMAGKVDGSSIAGDASFGDFGNGTWTAKRLGAAPTPVATGNASASPSAASAANVNGKWDITLKAPVGEFPSGASLTQDGDTVSGTFTGPAGDVPLTGTVSGKSLTLTIAVETPQGAITITLNGDVDGDKIANGKADFGAMGQGEWTANRSKP